MEENHKSGKVGRVEYYHDMLDVGAVLADVLSEVLGDLAVALEKVLTGHALLAGSSAGGDDVLRTLESGRRVGRPGDVGTFECAVGHFGDYALEAGFIDIVEADVRSKLEHHGRLGHV